MTYLLLLGIEGMKGRGLCLRLLSPFLRTRAIFDSVSWDQNQTNHNSQYKQVILSKGGSEISKQKKKSVGKQQCQSHDWFSFCI